MARTALRCTFSGKLRKTSSASSSSVVISCILSQGREVRPCAQSHRVACLVRHAIEAEWPRRGTRLGGASHESAATPQAAGAPTGAKKKKTQLRTTRAIGTREGRSRSSPITVRHGRVTAPLCVDQLLYFADGTD